MPQKISASPDQFFAELMIGYRRTKLVLVANKLGIFDALTQGPRKAAEVADELGCDPSSMNVFLRALAALGLLEVSEARFRNSSFAELSLVSSQPGYVGNNLKFQDMLWDSWSDLEQVVRTGRPKRNLVELLS